jgi:two-component system, OmpR family, alkaline phosphatase synthesis response regulator PhoP
MTRILIVEDNSDLAVGLRNNLEIEGYDVSVSDNGASGLEEFRAQRPDLVVLDLMLPAMDGYRVLHEIRSSGSTVPVLLLTARSEETDTVRGLRLGADDYVTKPFGILELLARIEALLRRNGTVVSRLDLLQEVWGHSAAVLTRTVDTHVAELRRKLERDPAAPEFILTARKAGYRVDARRQ